MPPVEQDEDAVLPNSCDDADDAALQGNHIPGESVTRLAQEQRDTARAAANYRRNGDGSRGTIKRTKLHVVQRGGHGPPATHPRPTTRGDCLTSADRFAVDAMYAPETAPPPVPAGYTPSGAPHDGRPDGWNCVRPCVYVGCVYHLAVDGVRGESGAELSFVRNENELLDQLAAGAAVHAIGKTNEYLRGEIPDIPPGAIIHSCSLDLADLAASRPDPTTTLEEVGVATERTRERIRQVEGAALRRLRGLAAKDVAPVIRALHEIHESSGERDTWSPLGELADRD